MLRQTTARRLLSPGFCSSTFTIVVTVIVGVTGIKHIVTIMYISQLNNFAGCYLQWGFAPFLSQRWRSMIIAPDTKALWVIIWVLVFHNGCGKKTRFRCLTNTPLGGDGGSGEGHNIRIISQSLAFEPLGEHLCLFDSCTTTIIIIIPRDSF